MDNVVAEKYFYLKDAQLVLAQYPTGATGFMGDWTRAEEMLFEKCCELILDTLAGDAEPSDALTALGWVEMPKDEVEELLIEKALEKNISNGLMDKSFKDGKAYYGLTEKGRAYVETAVGIKE